MARKQIIPDNKEIWKRFEKCYGFNNRINLYDQVKVNEDFYIGNQWEGVEANGLPNSDYISLSSTGLNAYPNSKVLYYTAKSINMSNVNKIVSVVTNGEKDTRHVPTVVTNGTDEIATNVIGSASMKECSLNVSAVDGILNVGFGLIFHEDKTFTIKLHSMKIVC